MKRKIMGILIALFLIGISFDFIPVVTRALPTTTLFVDPPSIIDPNCTPGSTFAIDVKVLDAVDLVTWQVRIMWDTALLDAIDIIFGDFLAGQPEGTVQVSNIKNELGQLFVGEATRGAYPGVDGNGWLCSITFLVESSGETVLNINDPQSYYIDSVGTVIGDDLGELIKENGYFNNFGAAIPATVDIYPDPLALGRLGGFVTAYIELPAGYNVNDVNISTIMLNLEVQAKSNPTKIRDYDEDGIPDLMVKFSREEVVPLLSVGENTLTITGEVNGEAFEGSDTITAT
ncbi:MAG: cohesin domain-containing protein [Candidatus Bathyarchaeota archaeon]|nr:cohesin domain-containing protein [Candidatus Bathyarchaeota archaeon]